MSLELPKLAGTALPCVQCGLTHGLCICNKLDQKNEIAELLEEAIEVWINDDKFKVRIKTK
jgi:hypothetical protein